VEPADALAAAHADSRLRVQSAIAYLRMSMLDPVRMPYQEACEKALLELEDVPQVAVILREVKVEVEVPRLEIPKGRRGPDGLTGRELQILRYIDEGMTTPEIAEKLFLAPATIKSHVRRMMETLDVSTRAAAVGRARERGIL